jgi:beta-phosphoglucomutase-like phosphatase (HAD superfamily)
MKTGFVFDLDGTLIDSVYQHVIAWSELAIVTSKSLLMKFQTFAPTEISSGSHLLAILTDAGNRRSR